MRQDKRWWMVAAAGAGLALAGLLAAQVYSRKPAANAAGAAAPSVTVERGAAVVELSAAEQARLGVVVQPLAAATARRQVRATAVALPADELVQLRASYVAAEGKLEQARARAAVAEAEYRRLKRLHAENENASLKAVEAAEGEWRAGRAAARAAQQEVALAGLAAKQRWGSAVGGWIETGGPELERVLARQAVLVQVTLPADAGFLRPARIELEAPGGKMLDARLVSPFPRTDPRIQGVSLLYRAAARAELAPGMTLPASLAQGAALRGTVVPESAVVWKDGQAWAYRETAAGKFTRVAVGTDFPFEGGYFVRNIAPGERIAVRGAEALLSAEAAPRQPAAQGQEEDED